MLENYISVVDEAITKLGAPLAATKTDDPLKWSLRKGSSQVIVQLKTTAAFAGSKGLLLMVSPIMELPPNPNVKAALMEELMLMNHQASITSFSIANGYVYLLANRFVTGMDSVEILEMLQELGTYADYFDDQLKAKYGNLMINREDDANRR